MAGITVDVSDARAFAARCRTAADAAERRAVAAVRKTARDVQADAQRLAPVDTGALKSSISSTVDTFAGGASAEVGPTVEYGSYVELGTSRMAGQPYLSPAFDRRIGPFTRAISKLGDL